MGDRGLERQRAGSRKGAGQVPRSTCRRRRPRRHQRVRDAPIVESLLDTDFYKLLMLQLIRRLHSQVETQWALINRTRSVRLADQIDAQELREQLEHVRTLRLSKAERDWLGGL